MQFKIDRFKNLPFTGKMGLTLWLIGWIWLISVFFYLTKDKDLTFKLSIAVIILIPFIIQIQNWARWIVILGNMMGILYSYYFFIGGHVLIATVNVMLFGSSIYYLTVPATSRYFKPQSHPDR
jgi:glucose-6-phosphate-specific signal transduction histidine kinase